jgi:hypothetical protein
LQPRDAQESARTGRSERIDAAGGEEAEKESFRELHGCEELEDDGGGGSMASMDEEMR